MKLVPLENNLISVSSLDWPLLPWVWVKGTVQQRLDVNQQTLEVLLWLDYNQDHLKVQVSIYSIFWGHVVFCSGEPLLSAVTCTITALAWVWLYIWCRVKIRAGLHRNFTVLLFEFELKMNWIFSCSSAPCWHAGVKSIYAWDWRVAQNFRFRILAIEQ